MHKHQEFYEAKKSLLIRIAAEDHTSGGWKHITTFHEQQQQSDYEGFTKIALYSKRIETSESIDCCVGIMEIEGATVENAAHVLWTRAKVH